MSKLQRTRTPNTQFAVYISDTSETLKQTYNDNVGSKQGYNHAKSERSCFNGVREKANNFFFKQESMSVISLENVRKSKIVVYS